MKINLNREGDQFNRYQQNEHSSFTIAELPEHNRNEDERVGQNVK
jgi:hypothetical protein